VNDFGNAGVNITQVGNFTSVEYKYELTELEKVEKYVRKNAGIGKIRVH
jgi:pectate lyase